MSRSTGRSRAPAERWSSDAVPPQVGRTVVVTGGNSGIGFETAAALAAARAHVVIACRDVGRADVARRQIEQRHPDSGVVVVRLDLADQSQIADAAAELLDRYGAIHACINNAGLLTNHRSTTVDGFETTFGVNHLGHFAFVGRLLPRLLEAPDARIVTVTSMAHAKARLSLDDLQGERTFSPVRAYRQSKLANLLFTLELQRRLETSGVLGAHTTRALSAHPGVAATSFFDNAASPALAAPAKVLDAVVGVVFLSAEQGAAPTVRAATDPSAIPAGCYGPRIAQRWGSPAPVRSSDRSLDAEVARQLWEISTDLTGVSFGL